MITNTENLVSVSDLSNSVSRRVTQAETGEPLLVLRNNKPVAALVSIEAAERVARVDELEEDLKMLALALVRKATDSGERFSLEDVFAGAGIDIDALDAEIAAEGD